MTTESDFIRGVRLGIKFAADYLERDAELMDLDVRHNSKVEPIVVRQKRCAEILREYEGDIVFDFLDYDIDFPKQYRVYEGEKLITFGTLEHVTEAMRKLIPDWSPKTFPKQYALKVWTPDGYRLAEDPYRQEGG